MPLRKRKGRRGPRLPPASAETEENTKEDGEAAADEPEISPATTNDASMDEEERRARETIAALAQKYQVQLTEETNSLDIIRVEEVDIEPQPSTEPDLEEKENKKTSKIFPKKLTKLQKQTAQRGSSPVFKVPKPLTHHSTPAPSQERNLFGFESLDSPLTLSPVTTTPAGKVPSLSERLSPKDKEEEEEGGGKVAKPSPYSRLKGTYDIPFKKKTPKRPAATRRRKSTSGEDCWAAQLNAQFDEIEQFELAVE